MERNNSLCNYCRLIFAPHFFNVDQDDETIIPESIRTDTLPDLPNLSASPSKCPFCIQLKSRIASHQWPKDAQPITIGLAKLLHESMWESDLTPQQEGIMMLEVPVKSGQDEITLRFDVFAERGSFASEHMRIRRRPPSIDRLSAKCVERLHEMIEECADVHWQCDPGDEKFWPTRLIDVGPADGSVDAKLIVTSGEPEKYLALSHCWGVPGPGVRMLKTRTETLKEHMRGIPVNSMPLNFQDAISMTRALDFRYIWIDSLCIIQDSADDWAREGSQMDKIYKFARLTLAATSASTSEDGFLDYQMKDQTFKVSLTHCMEVSGGTPDSDHSDHSNIILQHQKTRSYDRWEPSVDDTTWNTRGWTLQERHLSRRLLHFTRAQIFWECRRGFASECGQRIGKLPMSMARVYGANDSSVSESESEYSSIAGSDQNSAYASDQSGESLVSPRRSIGAGTDEDTLKLHSGLYSWWFQVLADYTSRSLTFPSDKFAAISGLAKELNTTLINETSFEDTYLAGIWLGALENCLLWRPQELIDVQKDRPKVERAPSWSWARWDVACTPCADAWPKLRRGFEVMEYVGHTLELETGNRYGGIKSATLQVRGSLAEIEWHEPFETFGKIDGYRVSVAGTQERIGIVKFDTIDGHECMREENIYAMQVVIQQVPVLSPAGLVLRPMGIEGEYGRVGVFQLDAEHLDSLSAMSREILTLV